jgi:UDPglucose 6-dehydrogenase
MKISFLGLGKLGLPLATNFAKNFHEVVAIDKNKMLIEKLSNGEVPWIEKDLDINLKNSHSNIKFTSTYEKVAETDVSIILVNTPSNKKDGSFSNLYVEEVIREVSFELKEKNKKNHLFILSSTVMPTSINDNFIPLIESLNNWKINVDFGFCYVPDFVAIGQVINDFENPDFLLIGQSNTFYGDIVAKLYSSIIKNDSNIVQLSISEAEICKVALNAYITTKISFANYLGILCEKLDPNINVDNVTNTIGIDKRIGTRYFKSGASYGGTCFPRDTWAFMKISNNLGLSAFQMEANEKINNLADEFILNKVLNSKVKKIGFVGLGFKPGTSVVTEGLAIKMCKLLSGKGYILYTYDLFPDSIENLAKEFDGDSVIECNSLKDIGNRAELIVICNNDFKYSEIVKYNKNIIDPWRIIK